MCTPAFFSLACRRGSNWDAERKSSEFSNLRFDVLWAPAVPLAKRDSPSVPIPVFKGNLMLRISVLALAVLFLVGCGGGSMPFTPPHSGTSGGTASGSGTSAAAPPQRDRPAAAHRVAGLQQWVFRQRDLRQRAPPAAALPAAAPPAWNFRQQFFRQRLRSSSSSGSSGSTFRGDRPEFIHIFGLQLGNGQRFRSSGWQRERQRGHIRSQQRDRRIRACPVAYPDSERQPDHLQRVGGHHQADFHLRHIRVHIPGVGSSFGF